MASKVAKYSSRKNIIKNFYKPTKGNKINAMAIKDSITGVEMPAVNANFASGYPNEVSEEWYSEVDRYYNNQEKAFVDDTAAVVDSGRFSTATNSGNADEAFNGASLNKPLPALPNPYFEYLFADAEKTSRDFHKSVVGSVKYKKIKSSDLTKSALDGNPHIDPVKRDSDSFSVPGRPASSYYNSIDNLSYEKDDCDSDMTLDDAPSPPSPGPVTPPFHLTPPVNAELSAFSQYIFHQANVPFTTKDVIDSHLVAIGTGLQGTTPDIDEQEELEKEQATADFFNNLDVKETDIPLFPSPYAPETPASHAQEVQEYDYSQAIPKHALTGTTAASLDGLDRAILGIGEYAESQDDVHSPVAVKPVLKPKSPKEKVQEKTSIKSLTAKWIKHRQGKGQPISINTQASNSTTSSLKRAARDSFATRSAVSVSDDSVVYLGTKKIRTQSPVQSPVHAWTHELNTPVPTSAHGPTSPIYHNLTPDYITNNVPIYTKHLTYSLSPIEAGIEFPPPIDAPPHVIDLTAQSLSPEPATAIVDLTTPEAPEYTPLNTTLPTPLTANYKAYPGQFVGLAMNMISEKTKMGAMKKPKSTAFGDRLNANGLIIHQNCYPAPATPIWNYEPETLSRHSRLFHALEDLDVCLELAASDPVAMLRTPSEENLRREAHIELANARLEGAYVGQYRYYQGHLSVEEYVSKGLCVCWSPCACSRVCSRYGDVMCPCGGDLELEGDSDEEGE